MSDWLAAYLAGSIFAVATLGQFVLAYLAVSVAAVLTWMAFIHHSRHPHHRARMVVTWPRDGQVPRPVPCSNCDGTGVLDKNRNSFGVPANQTDKSRLWKLLLYSHGTSRICGACRGAGFRASEHFPTHRPGPGGY